MSARIVRLARGWIGTPYRHQASCRQAGCDCLGLVRGVWREALGPEPELPPPYGPDWSESGRAEALWQAAARHLRPAPEGEVAPGEVLLFRMRAGAVAKHLGIATEGGSAPRFVHAYSGRGVVESRLTPSWRRRLVARFQFPTRSA